jgi:hypothetical protein
LFIDLLVFLFCFMMACSFEEKLTSWMISQDHPVMGEEISKEFSCSLEEVFSVCEAGRFDNGCFVCVSLSLVGYAAKSSLLVCPSFFLLLSLRRNRLQQQTAEQ